MNHYEFAYEAPLWLSTPISHQERGSKIREILPSLSKVRGVRGSECPEYVFLRVKPGCFLISFLKIIGLNANFKRFKGNFS